MKTICLNPKIDGKQPKVENRIYSAKGMKHGHHDVLHAEHKGG